MGHTSSSSRLLDKIGNEKDPQITQRAIDKLWERYGMSKDGGGKDAEALLNRLTKHCRETLLEEGVDVEDERVKEWLRSTLDTNADGVLSKDEFETQIKIVLCKQSIVHGLNHWDSLSNEEKILALQRETEGIHRFSSGSLSQSKLGIEFANLFEELSADKLFEIRRLLDSNLCFRSDGILVDLRTIVFELLNEADKDRVVSCIAKACKEKMSKRGSRHGPYVVLSDVDDTLLPGQDLLKIAGTDRSWALDGSLYPGVAQMHKELRGNGPDDYSILFTARPPKMCKKLVHTLARIAGPEDRRRLSILPGYGLRSGIKNVAHIMMNDYQRLGGKKLERFRQYVQLFPESVGQYVFIGDDGQADFGIADELLAAKHPETERSFFAFIAIHAVGVRARADSTVKGGALERDERVKVKRNAYPAPPEASGRHRFFYFLDYGDLAEQLCDADWISSESKQKIWCEFQEELSVRVGASSTSGCAKCSTPGCTRETWNGQAGESCCRSCAKSSGSKHGLDCNRRCCLGTTEGGGYPESYCCSTGGCDREPWNAQAGESCCRSCVRSNGIKHGQECTQKFNLKVSRSAGKHSPGYFGSCTSKAMLAKQQIENPELIDEEAG